MNTPAELRYSKSHEWVRLLDDGTCQVGLTDYAQDALGDVVFVNLPEVGTALQAEETAADVESVKAVSDVYAPISGTVCEVNEELNDAPEKINQDPYGTWLFRLQEIGSTEGLMDAAAYAAFCAQEAH
jgi:glycine cleavage system H protein